MTFELMDNYMRILIGDFVNVNVLLTIAQGLWWFFGAKNLGKIPTGHPLRGC